MSHNYKKVVLFAYRIFLTFILIALSIVNRYIFYNNIYIIKEILLSSIAIMGSLIFFSPNRKKRTDPLGIARNRKYLIFFISFMAFTFLLLLVKLI